MSRQTFKLRPVAKWICGLYVSASCVLLMPTHFCLLVLVTPEPRGAEFLTIQAKHKPCSVVLGAGIGRCDREWSWAAGVNRHGGDGSSATAVHKQAGLF